MAKITNKHPMRLSDCRNGWKKEYQHLRHLGRQLVLMNPFFNLLFYTKELVFLI